MEHSAELIESKINEGTSYSLTDETALVIEAWYRMRYLNFLNHWDSKGKALLSRLVHEGSELDAIVERRSGHEVHAGDFQEWMDYLFLDGSPWCIAQKPAAP